MAPSTPLLSSLMASTSLPPNLSLLISNFSSFITIKLDASNFLIWKNQVQNILIATSLLGFVDGTIPCPQLRITDSSGSEKDNPEYLQWKLIDAHLLSCITATLAPAIYSSVLHLHSCAEIWTALHKQFTSLFRSSVHQLKNKLNSISKKTDSMENYLSKIKDLVSQLALVSSFIDDEDLVLLTLNGLPDEYDAFKTTIRARSESIRMEELTALLLSEAVHMDSKLQKLSSEPTLACSSVRGSFNTNLRGRSSGFRGHSYRGNRGGHSSRGNPRGSGRSGSNFTNSRNFSDQRGFSRSRGQSITCQICGNSGHSALDCWYRMDSQYQSSSSSQHPSEFNSRAFVAATQSATATSHTPWYLDSAATDHITHDLHHLSHTQPYHGSDQITVGNGTTVPIHNTGKGLLPTPHCSFRLNHVLHTPSISSNLLSVHKFTKDNNCLITFDDSKFVIQDKDSRRILHQGSSTNGLYHFYSPSSSMQPADHHSYFTTSQTSVSSSIWHNRLGHPSLVKYNHLKPLLKVSQNKMDSACTDCCIAKSHRLPFQLSNTTVNAPLSLILNDVWVQYSYTSGYKY